MYPPFVFNRIKRDSYKHYPLNHLIFFVLQYSVVNPLLRAYKEGHTSAQELLLFAPAVLRVQDKRFILRQHDLLQPFTERVHILRAMNVLNASYFSAEDFSLVIQNLHAGYWTEAF